MRKTPLLALALLASAPCRAEQAWPPPLPELSLSAAPASVRPVEVLDVQVIDPGLSLLEMSDVNGLGAEAAALKAWSQGRRGLGLKQQGTSWSLSDSAGSEKAVSPALAAALKGMNGYFGLTAATLAKPLTEAELTAAFLAPQAVDSIRRIFEKAMEDHLVYDGKLYLPEIGGEATLDALPQFHFITDSQRPVLRQIIARRADPAALRKLYVEQPAAMERLDPQGTLKRHLETRARWDAENKVPQERRDSILRMTVDTVVSLAANHYSGDMNTQLQMMIAGDWSGRFVGPWHCHPPEPGPNGWLDAAIPSEADYEAAAKNKQEIVLVFLADGFDAYELSAAAAGALPGSIPPFASYRSPIWKANFQAIFTRIKP
jgi:hypothetical protein